MIFHILELYQPPYQQNMVLVGRLSICAFSINHLSLLKPICNIFITFVILANYFSLKEFPYLALAYLDL